MRKLAIVLTHPIQYYAPVFQKLATQLEIKVFYTWEQWQEENFDKDFGKVISWDIPLLEGYNYAFVKNQAKNPGIYDFFGIDNPSIIAEISSFAPKGILIYGWNFKSHLKILRHFKGKVPIYFRGDSTLLDPQSPLKSILRTIWLKWIYSHIDFALYVGEANRAYFKKHGLKEQQLLHVPHAIDNQRFMNSADQMTRKAEEWRKQLGILETEIVVLFVGKLESKKDPGILIQAFMQIHQERQDIKLLIVGEGILKDQLQRMGDENKNIFWLPFQNQSLMPLVYRLGDILVLPSKGPGETWGLAINEAFSSGLPAITTERVGCSKDLILNDQTGWVIESGNLLQLQEHLKSFNKKKLKDMGRAAQNRVQLFDMDSIVKTMKNELLH